MTEAEWDAELDKATKELMDHPRFRATPMLIGVVAQMNVEFIHGRRDRCSQPAPKGILQSTKLTRFDYLEMGLRDAYREAWHEHQAKANKGS